MSDKNNKDKQDLKSAKKRIKELEKELNRKEKALAETQQKGVSDKR